MSQTLAYCRLLATSKRNGSGTSSPRTSVFSPEFAAHSAEVLACIPHQRHRSRRTAMTSRLALLRPSSMTN